MNFIYNFFSKHFKLVALLIFAINIVLSIFYFDKKDLFHPDETWSYAHANSTQGAFLTPNLDSFFLDDNNELHYRWFDGKELRDYVSVQKHERFKYAHIWGNLAKDVHPPLYFVILHTISSFFVDMANKWFAYSINLVAILLCFLFFYKLSKEFIKDKVIALLAVFLWGFSHLNIALSIYLRMYALQVLFAIGLVYEVVKFIREEEINKKRIFFIFLYSLLGVLTHFNSLVFNLILFGIGGFIFLCKKKYKKMFVFGGVGVLSVGLLFIIVPDAWAMLLSSQRAKESIGILSADENIFVHILENGKFLEFYFKYLFSFGYLFGGVVFLTLIGAFYKNKIKCDLGILFVLMICLFFSLYLAIFMPSFGTGMLRYYYILSPFVCLLTFVLLVYVGTRFKVSVKALFVMLFVLTILNSLCSGFYKNSDFKFQSKNDDIEYWEKIKGENVVLVSRLVVGGFFDTLEFTSDVNKIFAIKYMCNDSLNPYLLANDVKYVLVFNSLPFENLSKKPNRYLENCMPFLEYYKYLSTVSAGQAYFDFYERM